MQIDGIRYESRTLQLKCSGAYGVGYDAVVSARLLTKAIQDWIADHPESPVTAAEVDYRAVDYSYGDGPVTAMIALWPLGITQFRLVANSKNCDSLKGLLESINMPFAFQLIRSDEIDGRADFEPVEVKRKVSPPYQQIPHQQIPLDEARLETESKEFAVRLFTELPDLKPYALMEGTDKYSLLVEMESSTADPGRHLTISVESGKPSVFFGEWHTHADSWPSGVDDIVSLVRAILSDQFVIIVNIGGPHDGYTGGIDLRDPDALIEELTDASPGRVQIKSWTGSADRKVGLNDLTRS
jgi:hypothetical protein